MILIWLKLALGYVKEGLALALKYWRITLFCICCVVIYAHAVLASQRVSTLEKRLEQCKAQIAEYERISEAQKGKVKQEAKTVVIRVKDADKQKAEIHERIKYIYKTDPVSAEWATTPVPDSVADQLRDH